MRARVASRKGLESSPGRLWQGVLGPKASSIRLRKWIFVGVIAIFLIFAFLNISTNAEGTLNVLFSAKSLGHFLAFFLSIWLGFRAAALAQSAIYSLNTVNESQNHILDYQDRDF